MSYLKTGTLAASLCDTAPKLSVESAFALAEDMVTELLGSMDLDGLTIRDRFGAVWVFVQHEIRFHAPLRWNEAFTAESYPVRRSPVRLEVETVVRNACGELVFSSLLQMCALDAATQSIRRLSTFGADTIVLSPSVVNAPPQRLTTSPDCLPVETVTVRSSDIDFVHHTNNISYVRYLMNTYTVQELESAPIEAVCIRYRGQTHEGDRLEITKAASPQRDHFQILHDGETVIECAVCRAAK